MKRTGVTKLISRFKGYIILSHNKRDFASKRNKISNGDTNGFYTYDEFDEKIKKDNLYECQICGSKKDPVYIFWSGYCSEFCYNKQY